ncbi:MAG: ADP-ribosylglycohydrolase family protein [Acidobacteriota bacterium]
MSSRIRGALLGLAAGDALGTTLEFKPPGSFAPIADMVGGGPFGLEPGQWTDDTSMALCLAESLVETGGFDAADQMRRYLRWYREGHHSSTGRCFDIGNTVRAALKRFEGDGDVGNSGLRDTYSAGNGSLMRLAPVPLFFRDDPARAVAISGESSKPTHAHPEAVDACRYFAGLIVGALQGRSKDELLQPLFSPSPDRKPFVAPIERVAGGSFLRLEPPDIRGTGYVTASLEAALWAFAKSTSFEDGALLAVNLGDDADTTGAVYGQVAGAYYGVGDIPDRWLAKLAHREAIEQLATRIANEAPDRVR